MYFFPFFLSFLDLDSSIHLHCVEKITCCVPQNNYSYRFLNDMRVLNEIRNDFRVSYFEHLPHVSIFSVRSSQSVTEQNEVSCEAVITCIPQHFLSVPSSGVP